MNDELTTQTPPAPIVLKLKKYDDIILPHTSRLSTDILNENSSSSSSFTSLNETPMMTAISPSTLRVKLKKPFINGVDDDEYVSPHSSEISSRPAKRSKKSSSNDNIIPEFPNDQISSQSEMNEIKAEQPSSNCPLVLKIRRDSLTTTIAPTSVETESNRQLLLKLKKNEHGELTMNTPVNEYTNGHTDPFKQENDLTSQPHITNMLSNLNDDTQWNNHPINSNPISQQPTTISSHTPMDVTPTPSVQPTAAEAHTKEMLDEALDSVKNVLMQTFRKNLESGGDLSSLKSTLGSDEVAEVFLSKLRESLKRETISTIENEPKSHESIILNADVPSCPTPTTPSSASLNTIISPIMNVVSPSPSSSPLPSISTILTKTTSPVPTSPQATTTVSNNKRKFSTPTTNPNRFDGASEEELAKRQLSDILQPNLDIVFVGINPSLYAVHKGHHYGGPGNHFWKLLHLSDLIPNAFTADDDVRMPQYGIGFTNIVQRPSKAGSDITKDEITAGAEVLMQKIKMYRPKIVAFNGRGIYEVYAGNKHFHYGKQPDLFLGTDTHVFVMPSSSARCSQLPRAEDKLPFYVGLRKLRDFVNGTLHTLNEAEITFPDIKIKDTDDVLQRTIIRISNKPFSELSPETLKTFGDKIPSGQMLSKFNSDTITTQTTSILNNQPNGNLLNYDQQKPPSTPTIPMNDTDAAVLAALANGTYGSASPSRQHQTIYIGRQSQSVAYPGSSLKSNAIGTTSQSSTPATSSVSHTVHHLPQLSSSTDQTQSHPSVPLVLSNSQIVIINPNEQSPSLKDLLSSQPSTTPKQTFVVPTNPSSTSTNNQPSTKTFVATNKSRHTTTTIDDGLYLRYEREPPSTTTSFHFSYLIDEYSSTTPKRSRYVSINDL